jgi:hypothetical protein
VNVIIQLENVIVLMVIQEWIVVKKYVLIIAIIMENAEMEYVIVMKVL